MIRNDLIYKDECYKILGLIFEVFNEVGYGHKEQFYQKAVAEIFKNSEVKFKEQLKAKVNFKGKEIGYYYFDFLVFDKIVIELKQRNYFSKKDIQQIYSYLKAAKLKLGILVYFTNSGVRFKRIVNVK